MQHNNIFEDLGFDSSEAAKLKIKAQMMCQLSEWIKKKNLKQEDASRLLHVTGLKISAVMQGKSDQFTIDTLVDMLERTGKHVSVQIN